VPDDLPTDAYRALRWVDAFPWIEAFGGDLLTTTGSSLAWWPEPVEASGKAVRAERFADLSDLMLERFTNWTIGQIFPMLSAGTRLATLSTNKRASNALARFGYQTAGDLQGLELWELLDLPQVGMGTIDSLLQALAEASTLEPAAVRLARQGVQASRPVDSRGYEGESAERAQPIIENLRTLGSWYVALGMPARPLLDTPVPMGSPPEVIKARERLDLIGASDVLAAEEAELDAAELLQRTVSRLDSRAQQILARRFFADRPETLDDIGQDLGVTRERVRQIESRARADMLQALESGDTLCAVSAAVRELVGSVLPLTDLLRLIPALAHPVHAAGQPAWRVLDRLDDAYEIKDGWCAAPTILSAQTATLARLQEQTNPHGVAVICDLSPLNPNLPEGSGPASLQDWLSYCGYVVENDYVFTRVQSVGDRAAAILSVTGSPMPSQDILDRLGVERSLGSLRNVMASDDRFERVDRDKWALTEWDMETYSGIRALVREEIARSGGQIPLDTLIERITGRYTVTANSVIAYASAPPFEARAGIVRLATGERDARKGPERTRRLYRRADGWLYRITVTKEHLRGSGSPAPMALAAILGLQHGQVRQLQSALGPQTISWTGNQPAVSTIRRFLVDSDIETGSEIFLVIGDDGSFRIEPVNAGDAAPLERALRLAGATDEEARQHPRAALATAIGLPKESPAASIIGGYRERGDTDIAELLLSARDQLEEPPVTRQTKPSADIDEILDLL
jgi:RNA polymerase sigma factor (sigma-70 family)